MQPINKEAKSKQLSAELNKKSAKAKAKKRAEERANQPVIPVKLTKKQNRIAGLPKNRANNYKQRFNAILSASTVEMGSLSRKEKKALKRAKNDESLRLDNPQKINKKERIRPIKLITDATLLAIKARAEQQKLTAKITKGSKADKVAKGKSLVCITNGKEYKRLQIMDALPFTQEANWKFCPKSEYKNWVKLQPSKVVTSKEVKLTKKQKEENEKLIVRNARAYARAFKLKQGLNTFSRDTKIKLEEIALTTERIVYKRGKMGEPLPIKKKRKEITQVVVTPVKEVVQTTPVNTLPKSIQKWNKRKFKTGGIAKLQRIHPIEKK